VTRKRETDETTSVSERLDRELAQAALQKRQRKEKPTAREAAALRRVEAEREERQRWEHYRRIPRKHWKEMAGDKYGRQLKAQAARSGIPFDGATVSLPDVVFALHQLLAGEQYDEPHAVYATSKPELAWIFGVSPKTVDGWLASGGPAKTEHGYNLRDWLAWRNPHTTSQADQQLAEWRTRRLAAEARRAEVLAKQAAAEVVDRAEHEQELARVAQIFVACLERLATELPVKLEGVRADGRRAVIAQHLHEVREQLTRYPK